MNAATIDVRGNMRSNEPMSKHTVWAVGGPAEVFFEPADEDDLAMWLASDPKHGENLFWLGLGSNLLVRDGGIKGTVIHTQANLDSSNISAAQMFGKFWSTVREGCA